MSAISLYVAFFAGLVSFISPCVLPIIPGFLSYIAGVSVDNSDRQKREIFLSSVCFVIGFSFVFALLGVLLNTVLQSVAFEVQVWLSRIGGLIVIFFGLYLTGLISISFLNSSHSFAIKTGVYPKYVTSFLFGLAFAAGWTPCVGAALGAILGLATSSPGLAFFLLISYSLGLGIPFLIVGLFASSATKLINRFAEKLKYVNIVFGTILIVLGILIFTGNLSRIADFEILNKFLIR